MSENEMIEREMAKLTDIREAFLSYLDANIPKENNGMAYDFTNHPTLDAKNIYEHFYKLDYQARKIRGFLVGKLR